MWLTLWPISEVTLFHFWAWSCIESCDRLFRNSMRAYWVDCLFLSLGMIGIWKLHCIMWLDLPIHDKPTWPYCVGWFPFSFYLAVRSIQIKFLHCDVHPGFIYKQLGSDFDKTWLLDSMLDAFQILKQLYWFLVVVYQDNILQILKILNKTLNTRSILKMNRLWFFFFLCFIFIFNKCENFHVNTWKYILFSTM